MSTDPSSKLSLTGIDYWLTDATVVGLIAWVSLLVTIVGFVIALWQLSRVKNSADAAKKASIQTTIVVRGHEQSSKITSSVEYLRQADDQITKGNQDAAGAYLSIGWSTLIEAKELTLDLTDKEDLIDHIRTAKRILDEIRAPGASSTPQVSQERHFMISKMLDGLGDMSARVRLALAGIGA